MGTAKTALTRCKLYRKILRLFSGMCIARVTNKIEKELEPYELEMNLYCEDNRKILILIPFGYNNVVIKTFSDKSSERRVHSGVSRVEAH